MNPLKAVFSLAVGALIALSLTSCAECVECEVVTVDDQILVSEYTEVCGTEEDLLVVEENCQQEASEEEEWECSCVRNAAE